MVSSGGENISAVIKSDDRTRELMTLEKRGEKIQQILKKSVLKIAADDLKDPLTINDDTNNVKQLLRCSLIDVDEAFSYFQTQNLHFSSVTEAANARVRWKGFVNWLQTPPKINVDLKPDYDLICSISKCTFNWDDSVHWRMIQSVFKQLTGSASDCPQFGSHWQLVGFQGSDPSTDLRGVGLLGLLQLVYLSTSSSIKPLAQKLYRVSNSEDQPFPLAVLSLNVTQIALNALMSGKLNKECNNRHSVLQVLNLFYTAVMNYIFTIWVNEQKTIKDSGYLLKDAEKYCCKNVRKILMEINTLLEQHKL
ncbi:ELMO domain-containing protein 3-like isoform X2 [Lycorma delicatula]|uniref:ELMO domain-containing protein 3-like isoform X2 n=1 Tax=Lycorma delicatula TaxID=130591 RepID=UPI003F51953B